VLTLDDWLWSSEISPADFGRTLGLKWPYSVRRYLRRDVHRRPRKDWRAPRLDIQLKIEKLTWGLVNTRRLDQGSRSPRCDEHAGGLGLTI
jgi:hypothetical protein